MNNTDIPVTEARATRQQVKRFALEVVALEVGKGNLSELKT